MTALLITGTAWVLVSAPLALLIGKVIGQADRRAGGTIVPADPDLFVRSDAAIPARG